jgi:hypothetical protein
MKTADATVPGAAGDLNSRYRKATQAARTAATSISTGFSETGDSRKCGHEAAEMAVTKLGKVDRLDLAIVFASPKYDYREVLHGIKEVIGETPLLGCSTAGEFTESRVSDSSTAIMLISSARMSISTGMGRGLRDNPTRAVGNMLSEIRRKPRQVGPRSGFSSLLILSDGMAGRGEMLVDNLTLETGMKCAIAGGAAADGGKFEETYVFWDHLVCSDIVAGAKILSESPIGIGVDHGWSRSESSRKVTKAEGSLLQELDGQPALGYYKEYARQIGHHLTPENTNMFMMSNELGMVLPNNEIKVRAPLLANPDGSILMATEIPVGKEVSIVRGEKRSLIEAAETATRNALRNLGEGAEPAGVVVFNCVARKVFLGEDFSEEVESIKRIVGEVPLIGFNTYGEIARVKGQLSGFHNTTDVVCIFPR